MKNLWCCFLLLIIQKILLEHAGLQPERPAKPTNDLRFYFTQRRGDLTLHINIFDSGFWVAELGDVEVSTVTLLLRVCVISGCVCGFLQVAPTTSQSQKKKKKTVWRHWRWFWLFFWREFDPWFRNRSHVRWCPAFLWHQIGQIWTHSRWMDKN